MEIRRDVVSLLFLLVGLIICFIIGGLKLGIIYTMLWIDKAIIGRLKTPMEFGIELFSLSAILVGIMYGPAVGFLFGFLVIPVIWGILDVIPSVVSETHLLDTANMPFIPSFESFISGVIAAVAGVLVNFLPFFFIVLACIIVRFIISIVKDIILGAPPKLIAYIINLGLNIGIAFVLQAFFISIFF